MGIRDLRKPEEAEPMVAAADRTARLRRAADKQMELFCETLLTFDPDAALAFSWLMLRQMAQFVAAAERTAGRSSDRVIELVSQGISAANRGEGPVS